MLGAAITNLTGVSWWDETSVPSLWYVLLYLILGSQVLGLYIWIVLWRDGGGNHGTFQQDYLMIQSLSVNPTENLCIFYGMMLGYMCNYDTNGLHGIVQMQEPKPLVPWGRSVLTNDKVKASSWHSGTTIKALLSLRPCTEEARLTCPVNKNKPWTKR